MEINSVRNQEMVELAVEMVDQVMDQAAELMDGRNPAATPEDSCEGFIEWASSMSFLFKWVAIHARIDVCREGAKAEAVAQALKDDCIKRKIIFHWFLSNGLLDTVKKKHPDVLPFLEQHELFEYPHSVMKDWETTLTVPESESGSDLVQ